METSHEFFKRMGAKELPFNQLPKGYGWVTGCGGGDGWYYNYFMTDDQMMKHDYSKAIMCKITRIR
jgi:hypothetical protein